MPKLQPIDTTVLSFGLASWHGQATAMDVAHRHNDIELNYIERGAVTYLFGGQRIELQAGDTCVFWAARPHRLLLDGDAALMVWVTLPLALFLDWRLPDTMTVPVLHGTPLIQRHDSASPIHSGSIARWREDLAHGNVEYATIVRLELEAYLRRLALQSQTQAQPVAERHTSTAEHMAQIIGERHTEPLRVADIAAGVGLHPHYAMHVFRQAYGVSIVNYLTQYRIAHAQQLLATTDRSMLEIGLDVGFISASRFYSAFKQTCGISPAAYRATLRNSR